MTFDTFREIVSTTMLTLDATEQTPKTEYTEIQTNFYGLRVEQTRWSMMGSIRILNMILLMELRRAIPVRPNIVS